MILLIAMCVDAQPDAADFVADAMMLILMPLLHFVMLIQLFMYILKHQVESHLKGKWVGTPLHL